MVPYLPSFEYLPPRSRLRGVLLLHLPPTWLSTMPGLHLVLQALPAEGKRGHPSGGLGLENTSEESVGKYSVPKYVQSLLGAPHGVPTSWNLDPKGTTDAWLDDAKSSPRYVLDDAESNPQGEE